MASSPTDPSERISPPPPAANSAVTSTTNSPTHSDASSSLPQLPDTFADFIEVGDRTAQNSAAQTPTNNPQRTESPGSFLTGLFKKATSTIETTIEQAKRDISRNDVLSNAQESLSGLTNAVPTALSGMVSESRLFGDRTPAVAPDQSQFQLPEKTTPLKPLKAHSANSLSPLLTFVNVHSQHIFIITESFIEVFRSDATKLHHLNINEMLSANPSSPHPPSSSSPRSSSNAANAMRATCAAYLVATDEIILGHDDRTMRIFSVSSSRTGRFIRASNAEESAPIAVQVPVNRPSHAIVGLSDGSVCILDVIHLKKTTRILPPEICGALLGSNLRNAPVCSLGAASNDISDVTNSSDASVTPVANLFIGYEDGAVMPCDVQGAATATPFIAHGGKVSGVIALYGGILVLTIGDEADPSLAAFESETGRCVVRRMLPYAPTSICTVPTSSRGLSVSNYVCPSENAFIVGGDEGQVEIFRVVVLSPKKLELRLVRRISERVRGRRRDTVRTVYRAADGVVMGLSGNGELRRWRLSKADAGSVSILHEDEGIKCTYSESNIAEAISEEFKVGDETRLSSVEGVIRAQQILAAILEDASVNESGKDALVEEFQKKQAEVQGVASQADAELRRARRRIAGRFAGGLGASCVDGSKTENRLARASRRTAAFELEYATRRHGESLREIQAMAVEKLKGVLLDSVGGISDGSSANIAQARRDAEELCLEQETEY